MIAESARGALALHPHLASLREFITQRIAINQFSLGDGIEFDHHNVFGWSGGHDDHVVAGRTDNLAMAIRGECGSRKGSTGDDIWRHECGNRGPPTMHLMLQGEGWTDLGAQANRWGTRLLKSICWVPDAGLQGTRRGFCIR